MQKPNRLDFTAQEIELLLSRIESHQLEAADFPLLTDLLRAMIWLQGSLREKELSIVRLRKIFGIKTETAKKLSGLLKERNGKTNENGDSGIDQENKDINQESKEGTKTDGSGGEKVAERFRATKRTWTSFFIGLSRSQDHQYSS